MFFHEMNYDVWRWGSSSKAALKNQGEAVLMMRAPLPFLYKAKQAIFDPLQNVD